MQNKDTKKMIDINTLVKVKTYAHMKNISHTYVYKLAEKEKVEMIEIDGVKFIKI